MPDWMHDALCAQSDPEAFFPDKGKFTTDNRTAIVICQGCAVREPCLEFALDHRLEGIWGGLTVRQRRGLREPVQRDPNTCTKGHDLTQENTSASGRCLICQRETSRLYEQRRRRGKEYFNAG